MEVAAILPALLFAMQETHVSSQRRSLRGHSLRLDWSRLRMRRPAVTPRENQAPALPTVMFRRVRTPSPLGRVGVVVEGNDMVPFVRLPPPVDAALAHAFAPASEENVVEDWQAGDALFEKVLSELACSEQREQVCAEIQALENEGVRVPREFFCPITLEPMRVPVVAEDGHSYERAAILTHMHAASPCRSPITGVPLGLRRVFKNYSLQMLMDAWVEAQHGEALSDAPPPTDVDSHEYSSQ